MVRGRACRRHFILTGFPPKVKEVLVKEITELGGQCSETEIFLLSCTHVVCNKPSRSEKYLGGLATGKWLLTGEYVHQSHAHGAWLPEEAYEWDRSKRHLVDTADLRECLGTAAKWRHQMTQFTQGAFIGWRVVVLVENIQKRRVYQRLLRFGHAVVVAASLPVEDAGLLAQQLTHVFVDDKHLPLVLPLAQAGVLCLKPLYIGAFLLLDPPPDPLTYSAVHNRNRVRAAMPRQPTPTKSLWPQQSSNSSSPYNTSTCMSSSSTPVKLERSQSLPVTPQQLVACSPIQTPPQRFLVRANGRNSGGPGQKRHRGQILPSPKGDLQPTALDRWLTSSSSAECAPSASPRDNKAGACGRKVYNGNKQAARMASRGSTGSQKETSCLIDLTDDQPMKPCVSGQKEVVDLTVTPDDEGVSQPLRAPDRNAAVKNVCAKRRPPTPPSEAMPRQSSRIQQQKSSKPKPSLPLSNSYVFCTSGTRDTPMLVLREDISTGSSVRTVLPGSLPPDPVFLPSSGSSASQEYSDEWKSGLTPPPKRLKSEVKKKFMSAICKPGRGICMPVSTPNVAVFEACLEEKRFWYALDVLLMSVSSTRYHSSEVLHAVIKRVLLPSEDMGLSQRAYRMLWRSLRQHPPTTPALQETYLRALGDFTSDPNQSSCHWASVHEAIDKACDLDSSLQARVNHLFLLQFVVELLQADCRHLASRQKLSSSLVCRLLWQRGQAGCVNTSVQQLFTSLTEACQLQEEDASFPREDLVAALYDLLAMVANVALNMQGNKNLTIPHQARVMARSLAYCIKGDLEHLPGCVEEVVSRLSPAWLQMTVAQTLLDLYDDQLVTSGEPDVSVTLESIFSRYFLLLPPLEASDGCLKPSAGQTVPPSPLKPALPVQTKAKPSPARAVDRSDSALKRRIASANRRNARGESPLHLACIKNNVAKVKQLLTLPGINVNIQDYMGWTPLHEAANHGHVDCVRLLLSFKPAQNISSYFQPDSKGPAKGAGLDVSLGNVDGITALQDAVGNNHLAVVQLLLQHGGVGLLEQKTKAGLRAQDLALTDQMKTILSTSRLGTWTPQPDTALCVTPNLPSRPDGVVPPAPSTYRNVLHRAIVAECHKYLRLLLLLLQSFIRVHGNHSMVQHGSVSQHVVHLRSHIQFIASENTTTCQTLLLCFMCLAEMAAS